jgi:hypothetical protein
VTRVRDLKTSIADISRLPDESWREERPISWWWNGVRYWARRNRTLVLGVVAASALGTLVAAASRRRDRHVRDTSVR